MRLRGVKVALLVISLVGATTALIIHRNASSGAPRAGMRNADVVQSGSASPASRGASSASPGPATGGPAGPPASTSPSAASGNSADSPATGSSWFTAHVAHQCVMPGATQTLDVQSRPGYVVAYNAMYSDGKAGTTYGGAGYSPTNSDGTYLSTWVVSPNAPLGLVKVAVGTQRSNQPPVTTEASFTVAAHC